MFSGFPEETTQFFMDIRFHNSISWYQEHKDRYLKDVQLPFYQMIEDMLPILQKINPAFEHRPYRVLSRLRRDTRFTKDKSPYRDHLWMWFHQAGEPRENSIGYWFELGAQSVGWGLGCWGENRQLLDRFRREIAANPQRISGLIHSCGLPERHLFLQGSQWKRMAVPDNVPEELRSWYLAKEIVLVQTHPDFEEIRSRAIFQRVSEHYVAMAPIYLMLRGMQDELSGDFAGI